VNPDRLRWGDTRLDSEFAEIKDEIHDLPALRERLETVINEQRAMRDFPKNVGERLAEIKIEMQQMTKDLANCFSAIREAEDKRERREEVARKERKADRRWIIGSALTAATRTTSCTPSCRHRTGPASGDEGNPCASSSSTTVPCRPRSLTRSRS
jgi:chromosome segregation ATPase